MQGMVAVVLVNLDAIDWKSLRHAYGEASDVPKLIRALVSDHPGKREGALDALFSTIWHQGTVYSASPAAVPFLVELLEAEAQEDLPAILELLAHLATGTPDEDAEAPHNAATAAREAVSRGSPSTRAASVTPSRRSAWPRRICSGCSRSRRPAPARRGRRGRLRAGGPRGGSVRARLHRRPGPR
ncbi:hypothetical protein [Nannocystis pusilla]|uniref:hypothetical protein n=1 Tax=Nannocystis pusilla TaxID=889268 RepID=UPI003B8039AB